jgi:hypothetical protein
MTKTLLSDGDLNVIQGITEPHVFQVKAPDLLVFETVRRLLLVRKTGEGKSVLVFLTTALLLDGVDFIFYPLKSLAIDQETNASHDDDANTVDDDYITIQLRSTSCMIFTAQR